MSGGTWVRLSSNQNLFSEINKSEIY